MFDHVSAWISSAASVSQFCGCVSYCTVFCLLKHG